MESTDIYSLVEFKDEDGKKVRNDRDIKKDYIRGRYGAIPRAAGAERAVSEEKSV